MPEIPANHWLLLSRNTDAASDDVLAEAPSLRDRHQRWAELVDRKADLYIEIAAIEDGAGDPIPFPDKAQGGLPELLAEAEAAAKEIAGIERAITKRPARSFADLAVLLDVALEHSSHQPMCDDDDIHDWWDFHFARSVAALVPGFVFSYFSRYHDPELPLDEHGIPLEPPLDLPEAEGKPEEAAAEARRATLRARAAALAAAYRGPLPAGDAGLIEAERRHAALVREMSALSTEFDETMEEERDIINAGLDDYERGKEVELASPGLVEQWLWYFIVDAVPEGLEGVAVKLRLLRSFDGNDGDEEEGHGAERKILNRCIDAVTRHSAMEP